MFEELGSFISLLFHVVSCGRDKKGGLICSPLWSDEREKNREGWFRLQVQKRKGKCILFKVTFKGRKGELW